MTRNLSPAFARVAPFAVFMAFIAFEEVARHVAGKFAPGLDAGVIQWFYLPKVLVVGAMLFCLRRHYGEIRIRELGRLRTTLLSIFSGVGVFVLWINMDWTLGSQHAPAGFDPEVFEEGLLRWLMVASRIAGAVIVVPVMEELFWRSFLLRYLIDRDFLRVRIGELRPFSFLAVSLLFGLEHHYVFAGIMAGVVFNGVYRYTRSIAHCIVSHAVANFCLAAYTLSTSRWQFW